MSCGPRNHGRGTKDILRGPNNWGTKKCFFGCGNEMDIKDFARLMMLVEDLEGRRRGPWLLCRSRRGASTASTSARPPDHQIQDGKGEKK